jgi:hypothetical protein
MSSILNALKKLDKQSQPPKSDPSWPKEIDTKQAINNRVRRFRLLSRLFSSVVIVVIAVAGTWFFLSQKQVPKDRISAALPRSAEKEKAAPPVPVAEKKAEPEISVGQSAVPAGIPPTLPLPSPAIPLKLPEKTAGISDLSETKPKPEPPPVNVPEKMPAPNTAPKPAPSPVLMPGMNEAQAQKQKSISTADAKKPPAISKEKLAELDMLQDEIDAMMETVTPEQAAELKTVQDEISHFKETGKFRQEINPPKSAQPQAAPNQETSSAKPGDASRLKVQALVWSDDPGSRWAMVNDRIVRMGSMIGGATVTHIGEDHIIVQEGGEEWELKFQVK